jgi:hypothetical protein
MADEALVPDVPWHVGGLQLLEDVVGLVGVGPADLRTYTRGEAWVHRLGPQRCGGGMGAADLNAVRLADADPERHREPHEHGQLGDLLDGRAAVAREQWVELLLDEETRGGQHAHAAVRELGLAPCTNLVEGEVGGQVERVKLLERRD